MDPNVDDGPAARQDAAPLPLLERFPRLADAAPRIALAALPTPVERLPLEGVEGWIKRDDLTGTLYGGNKVRKLEFLLAAARAAGAQRLITIGAIGSHHALATTIYGVQAGFSVTVVLLPQTTTDHVRSVLLGMAGHGADIRIVRSAGSIPAGVAAARLAHRRERLFTIPAGGSSPIGTLGYVNAALELVLQADQGLCPLPSEIHVAGGTLGTAVGIALGLALAGADTRVIAHRITARVVTNDRRARRLVRQTLALLAPAAEGQPLPTVDQVLARFRIDHRRIGRGYGFGTEDAVAAHDWFAARVGIGLDLTYTAKAAAGFLAAASEGPSGPILYWHTLSSAEMAPAADAMDRVPVAGRRFLSVPHPA